MDKLKEIFKSKAVRIIAWVVLVLDVAVLILGGATTDVVTQGVTLTAAIVAAIAAVVAFIAEQTKD